MANVRVFEISKELGLTNSEVMSICERLGISAKSHSSAIAQDEAVLIYEYIEKGNSAREASNREFLEEEKGRKRVVRLRKTSKTSEDVETLEAEKAEGEPVPEEVSAGGKTEPEPIKGGGEEREKAVVSEEFAAEEIVTAKETGGQKPEETGKQPEKTGKTDEKPVVTVKLKKPKRTAKILGQIDLEEKSSKAKVEKVEPKEEASKEAESEEEKRKPRKKRRKSARRGTESGGVLLDEETSSSSQTLRRRRTSKKRGRRVQNKSTRPSTLPPKEKVFVPKKVAISGKTTVGELAIYADKTYDEVLDAINGLGYDNPTHSTLLDIEEISILLETLRCEPVIEEPKTDVRTKPPVVAVLGHVDHGKTTLLDAIRKTDVVATESGGITQHIGASVVKYSGQEIVFLDTPGHEVFTAMRARGAEITDILVLVVAADDGVMPQTVESINHAKASELPIIVAITKTDVPGADITKVKSGLANYGILTEDWGGDVQSVEVAAPKGIGVDDLLDAILLQAEMQELTADYKSRPYGVVIESRLDRGRGPVITLLVEEGVIKTGDTFLVNEYVGKIRAMYDDKGKQIKEAGPSMPAEIQGCEDVPQAGDSFVIIPNQKVAKEIASDTQDHARVVSVEENEIFSLDEWFNQIKEGEKNELNLIIKADVAGSVEALKDSVAVLGNEEIGTKVLHAAAGNVSESDVILAAATKAIIIAYRVGVDSKAESLAQRDGVEIREYDVIYETLADINAALEGFLEPEIVIEEVGTAEIRQIFAVPGGQKIAGCLVKNGKAIRGATARIMRNGEEVYKGSISSLKRFKDDVSEVPSGMECGIMLSGYSAFEEGDIIILEREKKIARRLN